MSTAIPPQISNVIETGGGSHSGGGGDKSNNNRRTACSLVGDNEKRNGNRMWTASAHNKRGQFTLAGHMATKHCHRLINWTLALLFLVSLSAECSLMALAMPDQLTGAGRRQALATTTTTRESLGGSEIRFIGPNEISANPSRDDTTVQESLIDLDRRQQLFNQVGSKNMRRALVRQLANLIMNHEPETIAEHMRGARVSGQMLSESNSDPDNHSSETHSSTYNNNNDLNQHNKPPNVQIDDISEPSFLVGSYDPPENLKGGSELLQDHQIDWQQNDDNNSASSINVQAGGEAEQYVTCPPDYEDQMVELSGGGNNLTAEQQQQLLAGVDSSGLLTDNANNESNPITRAPAQCVHAGSRMIEVITKIITPILFTIIIIVGLLGNIIVMMVILEDRKTERELTPTNLLILDLSLADLSFIIFCIPFTGWDYSVGHWVFGSLWCKLNQFLIVVCALSSIYTLVLMSVDRFMAIVYPIECISYRTSKNTLYAIIIKWLVILLMASPTLLMHGLIEVPWQGPDMYTCRFLADQYDPLNFQITFFITSYLFPLILIFCLYLSLLNKLWFRSKPHGHKESLKMLESKKKVTWLVAGIVVVFAICWCPIQIMLILMRIKTHRITATYVAIQVFAHTLGYMNSCVNPIVYAFASETFTNSFRRSVFGRFFRFCSCCSSDHDRSLGTNYNYQARSSQITFHNTTTLNQTNTNNSIINNQQYMNHHDNLKNNNNNNNNTIGSDTTNSTRNSQLTTPCHSSNSCIRLATLPLEPRDRTSALTSDSNKGQDLSKYPALTTKVTINDSGSTRDRVLIPREATISREDIEPRPKAVIPTKQQLVARVIQTGNNQASQICETACYQQEMINP